MAKIVVSELMLSRRKLHKFLIDKNQSRKGVLDKVTQGKQLFEPHHHV